MTQQGKGMVCHEGTQGAQGLGREKTGPTFLSVFLAFFCGYVFPAFFSGIQRVLLAQFPLPTFPAFLTPIAGNAEQRG